MSDPPHLPSHPTFSLLGSSWGHVDIYWEMMGSRVALEQHPLFPCGAISGCPTPETASGAGTDWEILQLHFHIAWRLVLSVFSAHVCARAVMVRVSL